jgi:hypothetical protein
MHKALVATLCAASFALAAGSVSGPAANAAIACHDGFQIINGQEISTPYCNDAHLAQIAREHGFKVTADEVRNNPARKYEICRWVGSDMYAQDYCPDNGGPADK